MKVLFVTFFLLASNTVLLATPPQPHIIFIIADDLGWDDVGFHGSDIRTPNIDKLAHSGIILNQYYVSPICSPTRSAIMTGRHPIHTGLQHEVIGGATPYGLPLNETTMAQHLKTLGYATHIVGKWHLGFFSRDYLPTSRGFDSHFGYYTGHEDYFDHTAEDSGFWGLDLRRNLDAVWDMNEKYATEIFTNEAENIILSHNQSAPLFLYLAHQAVHAGNYHGDPLEAPQHYIDRFPDIHDKNRRIFAGMVSALDDSVGNLTRVLQETGMLPNTIMIFTTDNGGPTNGYDRNAACNWPLRGVKNTMWEGGVRGTGFVHSALLKRSQYVQENLMHVTDWLPTLYQAACGDPSHLGDIDGQSLWDMLTNQGHPVRKEVLHNIDPIGNFSALRMGEYKLVMGDISHGFYDSWYPPPRSFVSVNRSVYSKDDFFKLKSKAISVNCGPKPANASINCQPEKRPCLFHIPSDPCEFSNIASDNKYLVQLFLDRLEQLESSMVPPLNTPIDPKGNPALHGGVWQWWK
ncbi:arylsulfatase B-like [Gigantopelta aegis]|uniref:arylsulfatase B-like n=1 Tax=Gigantopelta aegis TaxID=1735272 RepID=UPI001B8894E8|nr:arylsulfatase B-like [Gigantopelta aegis]XP_041354168.1 arylsulfatase B-like [Gigantopelta aegis]